MQLTESLPDTLDAWERGDLDWRKANIIADRTIVLDHAARHRFEELVLPHIDNATAGHDRERLARDVTVRPPDDGMSILQAHLCAEEAAAAIGVLNQSWHGARVRRLANRLIFPASSRTAA